MYKRQSLGWVALAMAFNLWLWWHAGQQFGTEAGNRIGMEFLTGYLVEKSLAVDNIFVFLMVFTYFSVPEEQRQRVLIIGILGAIVLRTIMIFAGAVLPVSYTHLDVYKRQDQASAGERGEQAAWLHHAQRQFVHVQVFLQCGDDLLAVAGHLCWIKNDHCLLYTSRCV